MALPLETNFLLSKRFSVLEVGPEIILINLPAESSWPIADVERIAQKDISKNFFIVTLDAFYAGQKSSIQYFKVSRHTHDCCSVHTIWNANIGPETGRELRIKS